MNTSSIFNQRLVQATRVMQFYIFGFPVLAFFFDFSGVIWMVFASTIVVLTVINYLFMGLASALDERGAEDGAKH